MNNSQVPSNDSPKSPPPSAIGPGILVGTVIGTVTFLVGYLLSVGDHTNYGLVIFLGAPVAAGYGVGLMVERPRAVAAACAMALLLSLLILILTGWEGYLCCLMALPLLAVGFVIGALFSVAWRRKRERSGRPPPNVLLFLIACPLLLAAADRVERPDRVRGRLETIESEIVVDHSPSETWTALARLNEMHGVKPLLLRVGLPVPYACALEAGRTGAQRTCYFDQGKIAQVVTTWSEPKLMRFEVTESTLPGRKWLTFVDAEYELVPIGDKTKIVRRSTISSRLGPRWYWHPFERWGVESEHEYVLTSIRADLERGTEDK